MIDAPQNLLTPRQAAGLLSLTTRTLRRWSIAFTRSLSETARWEKRKRFYDTKDIEVLLEAKELINQGLKIKEVAKKLPKRRTTKSPAIIPTIQELVERVEGLEERVKRLENN